MQGHKLPVLAAALAAALVVGACGDDSSVDDSRDEASRPGTDDAVDGEEQATAGCDADQPPGAQEGEGTLEFEGEQRTYLLHLPADYDVDVPHPLVLSFHGFAIGKDGHEEATELGRRGAARGYVVVTPDGLGDPLEWNIFREPDGPDNYGFVDTLVDQLGQELCLDPDRVFAAGHSEGSGFAGFLACSEPYRLTAVAMVAAFIPPTCPAEDASPAVMAFHGVDDPLVPYEGGDYGGPVPIPAALDTFADYIEHHDCDEPTTDEPAAGVERRAAATCASGGEVVLYSVEQGGHGWPTEPISATDEILDFFDRQDGDA